MPPLMGLLLGTTGLSSRMGVAVKSIWSTMAGSCHTSVFVSCKSHKLALLVNCWSHTLLFPGPVAGGRES